MIVIEAFTRAIDKARGKTLGESKFSACLPVWGHHIAYLFAKTIFKTMIALDPKGQFDARNFGRMVGIFLRVGVFIGKEVEPLLKVDGLLDLSKQEEKKIEDDAGLEHLFQVASGIFNRPIRNENQLFNQGARHLKKWGANLLKSHANLFLHLWNQPIEEHHKFLCGISEGFVTFLDAGGQFTGDRGRTNLYVNQHILCIDAGTGGQFRGSFQANNLVFASGSWKSDRTPAPECINRRFAPTRADHSM